VVALPSLEDPCQQHPSSVSTSLNRETSAPVARFGKEISKLSGGAHRFRIKKKAKEKSATREKKVIPQEAVNWD